MSAFLALLLSLSALAQESVPSYTDTNSVQALRNLEQIAGKNPKKLPDAELVEWVRARFAWIALLRLEGKIPEALKVFEGCEAYCVKHGPSEEWKALRAWGCGKSKAASPCR